ncbi:MAG: hypothetical protein WD273_09885 [Trueperaceae bacterium]
METVALGEEVIISYRGQPKARLTAIGNAAASGTVEDSPLFGMWRDRETVEDVNSHIERLRKSRY